MQNSVIFWIVIIIIVIFILIIWNNQSMNTLSHFTNIANKNNRQYNVNNFVHAEPKSQYPELVAEFGNPDIIRNEPKGAAIWFNKKLINANVTSQKIVLADDLIFDPYPSSHYDFIYVVININISKDLLCNILTVYPSVIYDQLKNELTIRGESMKTIMVILNTIFKMINEYTKNNNVSDFPTENHCREATEHYF
jgi:hypothetical protein